MSNPLHPLHNEESGNHPLPSDAREIEAVLRAGRRCYEAHPYFARRYGERGEAFTRSDGGYLVTLADHPASYVESQVSWLAGVLACRGMPRWLMEAHLGYLYEELSLAIPEREDNYRKLQQAGLVLREARCRWIAQADFDYLAAAFAASAGGVLMNAGGLLVAAVCDEYCGLRDAVPSLTLWLRDEVRFPSQWCAAVDRTVAHAHALVRANTGAAG